MGAQNNFRVLIICASGSELAIGKKLIKRFVKENVQGVIEVLDRALLDKSNLHITYHRDSHLARKKKIYEDFSALVLFDDFDAKIDQVVTDFHRLRKPIFGVIGLRTAFYSRIDNFHNHTHPYRSCDYVLMPGPKFGLFFEDKPDCAKIVGSPFLHGIKTYLSAKKDNSNRVLINYEDTTGFNYFKDSFFKSAKFACIKNNLHFETFSSSDSDSDSWKFNKERVSKLNESSICISNSSNCIFECLYLGIPTVYFEIDKCINPLFKEGIANILYASVEGQMIDQLNLISQVINKQVNGKNAVKNELSKFIESSSSSEFINNIKNVILSKITQTINIDKQSVSKRELQVSNSVFKIIINSNAIYFYRNGMYFGLLNHRCELSDFLGIMIKKFNFEYSSLEDITKNIKTSVFALATSYLNAHDDYSDTELSKLKQSFYNEFSGIIDEVAKKAKSLISLQS